MLSAEYRLHRIHATSMAKSTFEPTLSLFPLCGYHLWTGPMWGAFTCARRAATGHTSVSFFDSYRCGSVVSRISLPRTEVRSVSLRSQRPSRLRLFQSSLRRFLTHIIQSLAVAYFPTGAYTCDDIFSPQIHLMALNVLKRNPIFLWINSS